MLRTLALFQSQIDLCLIVCLEAMLNRTLVLTPANLAQYLKRSYLMYSLYPNLQPHLTRAGSAGRGKLDWQERPRDVHESLLSLMPIDTTGARALPR